MSQPAIVTAADMHRPIHPDPHDEPLRLTFWQAVRAVHRFEVGPMYVFVLIWGMLVAADKASDLWSPAALLALAINGLSLFSGFVLNAYSDYPIDRRSPIKSHVADACERIGLRRTAVMYWVEQAITVILAAVVSVMLHNWAFVGIKTLGIFSGWLYNGEPARCKRRGLWNPIMLAVRFGLVPGWIGYLAVHHGTMGAGGWVVLGGLTLVSLSRGFWNAISDTDEDRAENIATPAVRYGVMPTMRAAMVILLPAIGAVLIGLQMVTGSIWLALIGTVGIAGATVYRFMLLRRTGGDARTAITLLQSRIRATDGAWSKATYWTVALAGLLHLLTTTGACGR